MGVNDYVVDQAAKYGAYYIAINSKSASTVPNNVLSNQEEKAIEASSSKSVAGNDISKFYLYGHVSS